MRALFLTAFISTTIFVVGNSAANDSVARVGAGSIVLLKTKDIRMAQEILEISTQAIRVKYQFKNEATTDIRTTVAFPLPPYGWNPGEAAMDENVRPLRNFKLIVDGTEVPTRLIRKAVFRGRDITDKLRKIGLSDSQIFETFGDCNVDRGCGLTNKQRNQIARALGEGHTSADWPDWKIDETVYWEQLFPAGRTIEVQHEYKPFVGMTYGYPYQERHAAEANMPRAATSESESESDKEACLDDEIRKAINKRIESKVQEGVSWVKVVLRDVEYILGTGRNWKGPISDFRLRIAKESPDQIVSLCFPGKPKKLSPTVLEFSHTNFVPQDRLIVHFYTVLGTN